jgi:uncharacterized protein DUF6883
MYSLNDTRHEVRAPALTARLLHGDEAVLDIRKIADYCLSPSHPRGRHKARVFREALDLQRRDAAWPREVLPEAARSSEDLPDFGGPLRDALASRCDHQATGKECCGKNDLDRANGRESAEVRHLLRCRPLSGIGVACPARRPGAGLTPASRTAAGKWALLEGCSVLWRRNGAPRPMKMGNTLSPWRFDADACCALRSSNLRWLASSRYA